MTIDRHIQTARKHLALGNVDAYRRYMRALFNRSMSEQTTNKLVAALKQDGFHISALPKFRCKPTTKQTLEG